MKSIQEGGSIDNPGVTAFRYRTVHNAPASLRQLMVANAAILTLGVFAVQAQPIPVSNFSFESQTAPNSPPYVNIFVDAWQKAPEPDYYDAAIGTPWGIPWLGTAGVFLDINPYGNRDGNQAGYLLAFPEVVLFQDYDSSPGHEFDATFEVGKAYNLTVGVFGKSTLAPGSTLALSLYYRNESNDRVPVASTTITYSLASFPDTPPLNLVDYEVNVPVVQLGQAWAGKKIGIELASTTPLNLATGGNWDFDNVRLTAAVPEPATLSLLMLGVGGLLVRARWMFLRS